MTSWHESQIIGVIVGAAAVFAATQIDRIIQRRKERKNLKAAIKSEVSVLVDFMESSLKWVKSFIKEWDGILTYIKEHHGTDPPDQKKKGRKR